MSEPSPMRRRPPRRALGRNELATVNAVHGAAESLTCLLNSIDPTRIELVNFLTMHRKRLRDIAHAIDMRLQRELRI